MFVDLRCRRCGATGRISIAAVHADDPLNPARDVRCACCGALIRRLNEKDRQAAMESARLRMNEIDRRVSQRRGRAPAASPSLAKKLSILR
jgi:hypothetical protein